MIDFDEIKARHRIEDFLGRRGIEVKRAAGGFTCKCPFHDGDNKASLFIHGAKQYAKCWTRCGYIGSVLDVVMELDGAENAIAAAEILEGRPLTEEEKSKPRVQRTVRLQFEDGMTRRPLPRLLRAEQLKMGAQAAFEVVAKARGLHWTGIKLAHDAGCVRFCREHWENDRGWRSEDFNCYAVLDVGNPCNVQFRRMDADENGKALPFWVRYDAEGKPKPTKVLGRTGNNGHWPVGIDVAIEHRASTILLVEGTGDFLAGWDIRGLGIDVIPVGIWGAQNLIDTRALPFFERREVVIVQQNDFAGEQATNRWREQLNGAHARTRVWVTPDGNDPLWGTPKEKPDLNDFVSAGGDVEKIFNT